MDPDFLRYHIRNILSHDNVKGRGSLSGPHSVCIMVIYTCSSQTKFLKSCFSIRSVQLRSWTENGRALSRSA